MKKLVLGLALEQRQEICNFCGESHPSCVKGIAPLTVTYQEFKVEHRQLPVGKMQHGIILEDYELKGFRDYKVVTKTSYGYYTKDYTFGDVVVHSREKTVEAHADICPNCIEQLAKLIK